MLLIVERKASNIQKTAQFKPQTTESSQFSTINHKRQISTINAVRLQIQIMSMRDPVCGAVLDENTAKFKISYEGETFHFCSLVCKKRFKRQPTKFVK
jgi:YHS domain-containing protein